MTEHVSRDPDDVLPVLQSKQERRRFYDKIAPVYDLLSERAEAPIRQATFEMLAPQPGERILEIGFGTGQYLVALAEAVGPEGRVLGLDISERMAELAKKRLEEQGLADRVDLVLGDGEALPFASACLDAVYSTFTLELFDTPEIPHVLAECRRVLKPGGRLCVASLSKVGRQGIVIKAYEWTHRHFPNFVDCRPIYVRRSIEAAGFEIRETRLEHMWVPVEIVLAVRPNNA